MVLKSKYKLSDILYTNEGMSFKINGYLFKTSLISLVIIMLFRSNGILGNSEFTWNWFYSKLNLLWKRITGIFSKKAPKEVEK